MDQAVALQGLEGLGEHLLAHAVDAAAQLVEAERALLQSAEGERAPAARDVLQRAARRTGLGEHVVGEGLLLHGVHHDPSVRERCADLKIALTNS